MSRPIYEEESRHIYNFKDHKFDVGVAIIPDNFKKDQKFSMPEGIGRLIMQASDSTTSSMQSCNM